MSEKQKYWFEEVPEKDRFWFLIPVSDEPPLRDRNPAEHHESVQRLQRMWESGYVPAALEAAENAWVHAPEGLREYLEIPQLYATQVAAEEELRLIEEAEPDTYLDMVDRYGEEETDQAVSNTPSLKVCYLDRNSLIEQLEESDYLCVRVDEQIMLREDFIKELKRGLK